MDGMKCDRCGLRSTNLPSPADLASPAVANGVCRAVLDRILSKPDLMFVGVRSNQTKSDFGHVCASIELALSTSSAWQADPRSSQNR